MKPPPSPPALASWMLRHLAPGLRSEDLAGDLLEELYNGRSRAWYWRQSLAAVAIATPPPPRHYPLASLFAVLWSFPLPLLQLYVFRSPRSREPSSASSSSTG